jgi:hypothetical protein
MSQVGIFGNMQMAYGVNPTFSGMTLLNSGRNLKTGWEFEDFIGGHNGYGIKGSNYFSLWNAAVGSTIYDIQAWAERPGIVALSPAIDPAGYAAIRHGATGNASILLGAGAVYTFEGDLFISNFSVALERYSTQFGFTGNILAANNEQAIFYYADNISANWLCINTHLGAKTITDSGVAMAAGAFHRFKVILYGTTRTEYWIDDVLVATHVANFPTGWGVAPGVSVVRTAAAAVNPVHYIDWLWFHYDLAATR